METSLIGVSKSIEKIRAQIKHVAGTGVNVVICGESGVGKEVVALTLYHNSPRKGEPFVKVNCAAIPDGLLESELFGYERGAFTGAQRKRRGKFELANGGVLFLDEIGDMPLMLQSKMLHVLQNGEFAPLGSEKDVKTDSWIIAATNHKLEQDTKNGKFREDLYYRLNIININIPPLRNRIEDIPPLIDYFVERYTSQFNGQQLLKPSNSVIEKLMEYHWPGNVRELQNVLKRLLFLGDAEKIIEELAAKSKQAGYSTSNESKGNKRLSVAEILEQKGDDSNEWASFSLKQIKKNVLDKVEKDVISYVLKQTGWNRSKAIKILKISYRTLLTKIQELNIESPPISGVDEA
jgi:transcriptional regulator with PAS, ATPase and Fis domain